MIAAALLRNQCHVVIGAHLAQSADGEANGEHWLIELLGNQIQCFVDVGANVGTWSRELLRTSPEARGLLVEPGSAALAELRAAFGDDRRVVVVEGAAGKRAGRATFHEGRGADELSSLVLQPIGSETAPRMVEVHALDDLVAERGWKDVDLVKIDAEGYDAQVIAGASRLLQAQQLGIVQFEYNWHWAYAGSTLAHTLRRLEAHGYRVFALRPGSLLPVNYALIGDFFGYANFVAVAPRCMSWLDGRFDEPMAWSSPLVGSDDQHHRPPPD